ncbi:hypothetical protein JR316_0009998 [Psilocybe cubensis]|uniref:Uncharacterized protein n=1 Tax=Psilocybe cubensis TaxID=181762 RepID=A0ACB8GRV3_PSICU|nr:hypothetical protein JR316_0009998 [Psilocybe cubensis]KAH9477769.1 hypothetical protein JR316_0009998 [Psilocybe cubensis]
MPFNDSTVDCNSCGGACGYLTPDPDVAGLGVVIAFLTTSSITWVCAVIRILDWFLNYTSSPNKVDALLQQYHYRKASSCPPSRISPLLTHELYPFSPIVRPKKSLAARVARLSSIVCPVLLSLHDTQLASGLAISVTALIRSRRPVFSVYHFSIAADLTWIASGTQMVSFIFIRSDIKDDQALLARGINTHRIVQILRAACMFTQMVVLLWLSYIQGERRWAESYACPVLCLQENPTLGGVPLNWMIANYVLVLWSYPVMLLPLCTPLWSRWKDFKVILDKAIDFPNATHSKVRKTVIMLWAFLGSMTLEILVQLGWFGYGVWNLVADRQWGDAYFRGDSIVGNGCDPIYNTEDDWGFGQIFPVMILIVLLMTLFQAHGDAKVAEIMQKDASSSAKERRSDTLLLLEAGAWASTIDLRPLVQVPAPSPALHGLRSR